MAAVGPVAATRLTSGQSLRRPDNARPEFLGNAKILPRSAVGPRLSPKALRNTYLRCIEGGSCGRSRCGRGGCATRYAPSSGRRRPVAEMAGGRSKGMTCWLHGEGKTDVTTTAPGGPEPSAMSMDRAPDNQAEALPSGGTRCG